LPHAHHGGGVYQVFSAQSPFPQREDVEERSGPADCEQLYPIEWKETMPLLPGDDT